MTSRILIVDDHEIVREGIRTLLNRARPQWEICGEATNGQLAIEAVKNLKPDLIILDVTMPVMSGLEAAPRIVALSLGTRILIFTMHQSETFANEVRHAGGHGYVVKSQASRDLILAIDSLLAGGTFFSPVDISSAAPSATDGGSSRNPVASRPIQPTH
jgi:two-component system nitrate/nitrite response regulator NarL